MRIRQVLPERSTERAVLVPAILAAGLLFSFFTWLRDVTHRWRGRLGRPRRAIVFGSGAATLTVAGPSAARADPSLARTRATYGALAAAFGAFAAYLVLGSWGNYAGWTQWAEGVAWLWAVFLLAALGSTVVGVACATLALGGDRTPSWARWVRGATPLSRPPADEGSDRDREPQRPLGPHAISERTARRLRRVAALWGAVVVLAFASLTLLDRIPRSPEGDTLGGAVAQPVALAMLAVATLGIVVEWRHPAVGAALMAVAAGGVALLSSIQFPPPVAAGVALLFAVPPFLSWLAWQRTRSLGALALLAGVTAVLIGAVTVGATQVYDRYYGPAHPGSDLVAPPPSPVSWIWAGGTTGTEVTVVASLSGEDAATARLAVSSDASLADPRWSGVAEAVDEDHRIVRFTVSGLEPDRSYHYAVEVDGELDLVRAGAFRTFPEGPASFTMALSSCARTGSNGAVFDTIREREPLAFLITGDMNYGNVPDDDPGQFLGNLTESLTAPSQSALYRSTSIAYVWDDHDYGGNDGDRTSASRAAAHLVYRAAVPHYPLPLGPDGPIAQSFRAGRVTFVMTDGRSDRDPVGAGDDRSMLGARQLAWFEEQLRGAAERGDAVVWINPSPWVAPAVAGSDGWAGFDAERRRIADLLVELGLTDRMVMVSGDAHMVALDDGTNTDYSSAGDGGFPLLHAAALDRPGGEKGGPYSGGTFPGSGQFGEIEVRDDGAQMDIVLRGLTWEGEVLVEETFAMAVPPSVP